MTAKEFLEEKQAEHLEKLGVYADTNSKIAEWMEEHTKIHTVGIIKKLSQTETEYQYNIKYVFPQYNIK